ncbi:mRNA-capping enzyme subunit beta [Aspergillus wentii]|nr:mRNA-capping enzyme subunit beta [Aspergillus wentii]
MDLRTIMNSDAAGASNNNNPTPSSRQSPSQASISHPESAYPPRQQQQPQHASSSSVASYPPGYPGRPAQPPPLQPPHASPDRSSSYGSIQSPYRYNPASGLNAGASSQRGQSPPAAVPPSHPYSRSASTSYTHELQHHQPQQQQQSAGPLASPYKPQPINTGIQHPEQQQSYFAQQRSQSIQEPPPSASSHPYQSQQFSPSAHGSLPGTPLGPPPASYTRHSPSTARPPSAGHDSQSNQPSSPWVRHNSQIHDQRNPVSPTAQSRNNSQVEQTPRQHPLGSEREQSESVSPKTLFTPGSRQGSTTGSQDQTGPSQRNRSEDMTWKDSPTGSASGPSQSGIGPGAQVSNSTPTTAHRNSSPPPRASLSREIHPGDKEPTLSTMMDVTPDSARSSPHPPKRKRMRYDEPPIYAQRSSRTKGKCPPILNRLPPVPKHARDSIENPWTLRKQSSSSNAPAAAPAPAPSAPAPAPDPAPATPAPKVKAEEATTVNGPPVSHSPAGPPKEGSLGQWEPSITGFIPHEETTKLVCDFLFQHVVLRNDVGAGPAGSSAVGQGAIIEVEAKLGQLIDMDRGDRLRLPIMTESVLNKEGSRLRTSFESSMTLAQHRAMNNFLNETVKSSMPQNNPGRIPISYAHKKERDTFYEVSPSELPPVIRQNLNPRHKPRVRVTTDQRTGEILAKIVKCRVADMDVHSPRTCVDWRVSVNLEMSYDGDVSHLPIIDTAKGGRSGDRNKDRMSYRHLAYQVDLTQVAKSEIKGDFEHELEVEVSAAEIRRQGQLAMTGDPKNQYEDLVKGFVDNIRILARTVPP